MTGTLYSILGDSYEAVRYYEEEKIFSKWISSRELLNARINEKVFSRLRKVKVSDPFSHQFYLDTIHTALRVHLTNRLKIFSFNKKWLGNSKSLFQVLSLCSLYAKMIRKFGISLYRFRHAFSITGDPGTTKAHVCIGFPAHAFAYEKEYDRNFPKSFVEYILSKEAGETKMVISVDEYERGSKKLERDTRQVETYDVPASYPRSKIHVHVSARSFFAAWKDIVDSIRYFRRRFRSMGFFLLTEYLFQRYYERRNVSTLQLLAGKGIVVSKIHLMAFHDIGLLKYGSVYDTLLSVFSYSQNLIVPPANHVLRYTGEEKNDLHVSDIMKECDLAFFTFFSINHSGFVQHTNLLAQCRRKLNEHFEISLPGSESPKGNDAVHLGYESVLTIDIADNTRYVLLFDVPIEPEKINLERNFLGDKTATKNFVEAFYNDILTVIEKNDCRLLLKPKYSLSSKVLTDESRQMIFSLQERLGNKCVILDPYVNIKPSHGKIELSVNFPFTSTYYSMANTCKNSVFYIPDEYAGVFGDQLNGRLVKGRSELERLIA